MKLATLKNGTRDGRLVVVSRDLSRFADAASVAPTLQVALETWSTAEPKLRALAVELEKGGGSRFDPSEAMAPLPRAYQWLDASAFQNHVDLMGRAFGMQADAKNEGLPLVYQGMSDGFLGPREDILVPSEKSGIDFEGEFCVVLDDVPMGIVPDAVTPHIKLVGIVNDVSLRALAIREMHNGFGFIHAKPSSSFGPVFVTPDELGDAWKNGRVCLPLHVSWNGVPFGHPNGAAMRWSFEELVAYAAQTRKLGAGTIFGSGTVSNEGREAGSACISERRAIEMIDHGAIHTEFMKFGDRVRIEALDESGGSVFGTIDQKIAAV